MEFKKMRELLCKHFEEMSKDSKHLFEVNVDKDRLWDLYLDSFSLGTNKMYRKRREHDCSCCRQFIRNIGGAVIIKNNEVHTIWEFDANNSTFQPVLNALDSYIKSCVVSDVYVSKYKTIGTFQNFEHLPSGEILEWNHFALNLPDKFVDKTTKSEGEIKGAFRDVRNVFKRSLDEISKGSVEVIQELIAQNSLYKGEEWKWALAEFVKYKDMYMSLSDSEKELFAWEKSSEAGSVVGKIRNHSIGTLLVNISEGMDLDLAVRKYEQIVAPENYKRSKPVFTQRMLEDARKTIEELGYMDSLERRYATLDDITVNNILFSNKDSAKRITGSKGLFDEMSREVSTKPKKFERLAEIEIEKFITEVLPTAQEVEVYLENKHEPNMMSLIAPKNVDAPSMFKWDNAFSWAYTGNITDSSMKERVKAAGGKVDGDLRFSIQWNDMEEWSMNDLDAHCIEPSGEKIYFGHKVSRTRGNLDVDIRHPSKGVPAVENITWANRSTMNPGIYKFYVHQYCNRGGRDGFRAEIEFDGQIYAFDYGRELRQDEIVVVAEVILDENRNFTICPKLPSTTSSKEIWNLKTNQFIPVSVVMYSPNYWDAQTGIGNKHYFFMLKDCVNPENPNGMFNEYLKEDLMKHRKVFEALGSKVRVETVEDQLSGLGFSSTKRNELVVKVKGATERIVKVKF